MRTPSAEPCSWVFGRPCSGSWGTRCVDARSDVVEAVRAGDCWAGTGYSPDARHRDLLDAEGVSRAVVGKGQPAEMFAGPTMGMSSPRKLAIAFGVGRIAYAAALVGAPHRTSRRWLGGAGGTAGGRVAFARSRLTRRGDLGGCRNHCASRRARSAVVGCVRGQRCSRHRRDHRQFERVARPSSPGHRRTRWGGRPRRRGARGCSGRVIITRSAGVPNAPTAPGRLLATKPAARLRAAWILFQAAGDRRDRG